MNIGWFQLQIAGRHTYIRMYKLFKIELHFLNENFSCYRIHCDIKNTVIKTQVSLIQQSGN